MKGLQSMFMVLFFCLLSTAMWGQRTVSGTVKDGTGLEMIGVTIYLKDQPSVGTITDFDGTFQLEIPSEDAILIFSYTGYETKEFQAVAGSDINMVLEEDVANLNEVVVIGYGVQKKSVVTASIAKVDAEELENLPLQRVEETLQGRTPGVTVTKSSGQPNAGAAVRIRGTTGLAGSDPTYIVDGVPVTGGIDYLNPSDIESIEVLKDASAAIYGVRAANGIVLVTTKKGKKGTIALDYNSYYGIQNPWRKMRVLNSTEYATLINESQAAAGQPILYDDPASLGVGTDWQDEVFEANSPIQDHSISVRGGSESSTYFFSMGLFDQQGIVAAEDSYYRRYTVRFNSDHKIGKRLKIGNNLAYTRTKGSSVSENSEFGSPLGRAVNIDPLTPVYETDPDVLNSSPYNTFPVVSDENGVFAITDRVTSEIVNPLAAQEVQQGFGYQDKIVGNVYGELEILEGLKLRTDFGVDLAGFGGEGFTPVYYLNASNQQLLNSYGRNKGRTSNWNWENNISYSKKIGVHNFTVLLGTTALEENFEQDFGVVNDIPVTSLEDASLSFFTDNEDNSFSGFESLNRFYSYYGRLLYNFQEKYLFTFIYRRDASSKFLPERRFATFPSVSAGWVVTEEPFFQRNPYVNFLKIRGSWGKAGNNNINNNAFRPTVSSGRTYTFGEDEILVDGVSPDAQANPFITWEVVEQFNVGFDSKLFKKFSFTFDYFEKYTRDFHLGIDLPDFTGAAGPTVNAGTWSNKGVDLQLIYNNTFGQVGFNFIGNASYVRNNVEELAPTIEDIPRARYGPQGLLITRIAPDNAYEYFYGFQTDGIFQNAEEVAAHVNADGQPLQPDAAPGDFRFIDENGDGVIDDFDQVNLGDSNPEWSYGLTVSATYKDFELSIFGQGVYGNEIYNATRRFDLPTANLQADALGRWTGEGTSNDFPRLIASDPNRNFSRSSSFNVESGAYFRIKNVRLSYNLPKGVLDRVKLRKALVYVSANNLLTITDYSGFDPEIIGGIDRGIYPQARTYIMGINVGF